MAATRAKDLRGAAFRAATNTLVEDFRSRRPLRTGSLLISIFGDAIAPHGGAVWLGSLINSVEPFGINQRLVRTSVFRLVKDGWLQSEQIGRRSYYSLTAEGSRRFEDASRRIYSEPRENWDGEWCLVMLAGVDSLHRDDIRKELSWQGFAPFSANVLAHPSPDHARLEESLQQLNGNDDVLVMSASASDNRTQYLRELVHDAWALRDLDDRYQAFLERFRPVFNAARKSADIEPEQAFQARTLLIHEYRKILLRDPSLPDALLPERWNGVAAYQLCRNIYSLVAEPAEAFLTARMESADGPLPPADNSFWMRFGGINNRDDKG